MVLTSGPLSSSAPDCLSSSLKEYRASLGAVVLGSQLAILVERRAGTKGFNVRASLFASPPVWPESNRGPIEDQPAEQREARVLAEVRGALELELRRRRHTGGLQQSVDTITSQVSTPPTIHVRRSHWRYQRGEHSRQRDRPRRTANPFRSVLNNSQIT